MKKYHLLIVSILITLAIVGVSAVVVAQQQSVPAQYKGMTNPFPWNDTVTAEAGSKVYQQSCAACHGVKGNALPQSNFGAVDFPATLEQSPDYYFWMLSEGRPTQGMPPYKSTLTSDQRWQVLTYMWALNKVSSPPPTSTAIPPPTLENVTITLVAPRQVQAGTAFNITAVVKDKGQELPNAPVTFFIKLQFFATGAMEVGQVTTSDQGVATFNYTPREEGDVQVIARYQTVEASVPSMFTPADQVFYQTEVGIDLPSAGPQIFIGSESAKQLGMMGQAPTSAFRLPGGLFSWLWILILGVLVIYGAYFTVMLQVLRIPKQEQYAENNLRLVPILVLWAIAVLGLALAFKIGFGPFSHFHTF